MSDTDTNSGSLVFRPRARIIRTIGRDLISNGVVALVELIKNAYDADATKARIVFEEPLRNGQGSIHVYDDGDGMTFETIKTAWFEPATISKRRSTTTPSGRRMTGEKGIGRFAAARLAQAMEIESVSKETKRLVRVRFDWGRFDDEKLFLDEVSFKWEDEPAGSKTNGTALHLVGTNDKWDSDDFAKLRGELSKLISPHRDKEQEFEIVLELPAAFQEYSGKVTPPAILGRPHYLLQGEIDAKGELTALYTGPDTTGKPIPVDEKLATKAGALSCGPFSFEFRVWDRDSLDPLADSLGSTVRALRKDLDAASGVSVYRDDFRVLMGDGDWLRLDTRRVQNPTLRVSQFQIVGGVFITADGNKFLNDQSNREGIVSSDAFTDFKQLLIAALAELELKRDTYRRGRKTDKPSPGLFTALDIAPLREYIEKRYPKDAELRAFIGERSKEFEHGVEEVQQVLARYRRLATLGQIVDVVLHEGRTPIAAISGAVDLASRDIDSGQSKPLPLESLKARLATISKQTEVLTALFKRLAPFSGRKRGRPKETAIEDILSECVDLFRGQLEKLKVKVSLPTGHTLITVDPIELQQIFVNLMDNSLHWIQKVDDNARQIAIEVLKKPDVLEITFSDSGPGVKEDLRDRIFDLYVSGKPDGVGLGLTIAGEIAAEYNGDLELISNGPLPGATFRVRLRKRIGGSADI